MRNRRIIVISGNAAGPAAAAKAKRFNSSAEVILIEASPFISTGTCELPYLVSGVIDDFKKILFYDEKSFAEEKNVKVYTRHFVESIDRKNKKLEVRNLVEGSIYNFDYTSLILCTGSIAKHIIPLQPEIENCFYFKNVNDYLKLSKFLKGDKKKFAIIGTGYIGLELTEAITSQGHEVILFEKENFPMPSAEPSIQKLILELLNKNSLVNFIPAETEIDWIKDEKMITAVKLGSRIIEINGVIAAAGFEPNSQIAISSGLGIGRSNGISVNKKLQTSDPIIFAAGDCIEVKNFITNQFEFLPVATLAQQTGHVAGENAAGGNAQFESVIKNVSVKIFSNYFAQIGITELESNRNNINCNSVEATANNLVQVMPDSKSTYGKIVFEKSSRRILGASFFGAREVDGYSNLISSLILQRTKVDHLSEINYNYTPPLSPFINLLSILGRKANQIR